MPFSHKCPSRTNALLAHYLNDTLRASTPSHNTDLLLRALPLTRDRPLQAAADDGIQWRTGEGSAQIPHGLTYSGENFAQHRYGSNSASVNKKVSNSSPIGLQLGPSMHEARMLFA